jgi:hypothetical protein
MQIAEMNSFQQFTNLASELNRAIITFENIKLRNNSLEIAINIIAEIKNCNHALELFRLSELIASQYVYPDFEMLVEIKDYILNEGLIRYNLTN